MGSTVYWDQDFEIGDETFVVEVTAYLEGSPVDGYELFQLWVNDSEAGIHKEAILQQLWDDVAGTQNRAISKIWSA